MAEILSYSCPATEAIAISAGPPDPVVPPGLLADPSQRKLKDKFAPKIRRRCLDAFIAGLTFVFAFGSLADLCVFGVFPLRDADVIAAESGQPVISGPLQVAFGYAPYTIHHTQEISELFYNSLQLYGQVQIHVVKVGPFAYAELQRPWSDFWNDRWPFFTAGLLAAVIGAARLYWRLQVFPEKSRIARHLARNGLPVIARIATANASPLNFFGRSVAYQYTLPNGRAMQDTLRWYVPVPSNLRSWGVPMLVVYDPEQPANHHIYNLLPFEVELETPAT